MYKAYTESGSSLRVLDYNGTEDSMLEIWEWNTTNPELVLRAGIGQISQSSESKHDAKVTLNRMWAKPSYSFSIYSYYNFVMRGLVARPYPTTSALPDDKFGEVKE